MIAPKRSGLGRPSTGLTRYYLDVGWWRHPGFAGLPAEALMVWQACVGYSVEHATDGVLPSDPETLAAAVGLKLSWVRKALPKLEETGRIGWVSDPNRIDSDPDSDPIRIVIGYSDHNPTAAEIRAYTEERSDLGRKGNHERWHVARDIVDPECSFCCPKKHPRSDRSSDPVCDPAGESHGMGSNGLSSSSPPRDEPVTPPNGAASGGEEETREQFINRTLHATYELMAEQTLDRIRAEGQTVHNPTAWKRTTAANLAAEHHEAALYHLGNRTTGTYYDLHVELAEQLDPRCGPADGGSHRAAMRRDETRARTLAASQGAA